MAALLSDTNRHWSDEHTFQTARAVVVAELQHITFNEFLPAVLGQVSGKRKGPEFDSGTVGKAWIFFCVGCVF